MPRAKKSYVEQVEAEKPAPRACSRLAEIGPLVPHDELGATALGALHELLQPIYDRGVLVRQPGTLRMQLVGADYVWTLDCPTEGVQFTIALESLVDALHDFNAYLNGPDVKAKPGYVPRNKKKLPKLDTLIQ